MLNAKKEEPRKPDLLAYHVPERERGKRQFWLKIGAVYYHQDGAGADLVLEALPIQFTGRIVLRKPKANVDDETGEVTDA